MRFLAAVGFSLLLHAVAAFVMSRHERAPRAAAAKPVQTATRVALFFTRAADRPAVAAAARVEAPPRPAHSTPRPAAAAAAPAPGPASAPAPAQEAATPAPAEQPAQGGDPAAANVELVRTGYPGSGTDTVEVAELAPAQAAFDPAALHARLAASAQRCYPAAARRFGLTGEAQLDFCLDANGALVSQKLARSSGQALLDTAALDCVLSGAQPFPPEASGGCYSVPVRFGR